MTEKPRGKAPPPPSKLDDPGRLAVDDRGNVTWEWTDDRDLLADDVLGETARLRALVDPALGLQDDPGDPMNPLQKNPKGLTSGYNPYNSGALDKQSHKKKKNLKELSKWIELRKKVAKKTDEE